MRYRTDDLPPGKAGAFMPIPAVMARASAWGQVDVFGAPGTHAVEAKAICVAGSNTNQKAPNSARPSDVSPDAILPTLYIPGTRNMGPEHGAPGIGMTRRRFAELPVPALGWTRLAQAIPLIVRKGGRVTQPWPRAFQRYPTQGEPKVLGAVGRAIRGG